MKRKTIGSALRHPQPPSLAQKANKPAEIRVESTPEQIVKEAPVRIDTPEADLKQQIARLQQRQLAYLEETTRELEVLQKQVNDAGIVEELRLKIASLEQENALLSKQIQRRERAVQFAADNLGELARILADSDIPNVAIAKEISAQPEPFIEPAIVTITEPEPQVVVPVAILEEVPAATPTPSVDSLSPLAPTEKVPKKPRKKIKFKKIFVRSVAAAFVIFVGAKAYGAITAQKGEVAGAEVVTQASSEPTFDTYAESYVELPFAATDWAVHTDPDFGISIDYPKNTTNKVRTAGGNNLWFLRRNGYLMKITRITTTKELDTWWDQEHGLFLGDGVTQTNGMFKGLPAIIVQSTSKTITSGTSYFLKRSNGIYQFWIKDEPAATDDGQRIARMVDSLKLSEPVITTSE